MERRWLRWGTADLGPRSHTQMMSRAMPQAIMGRARLRQTRTRSARSNGHTSGSRPRAPPRAAAPFTAGPRTAHPWPAASARVAPVVRATARGERRRCRTLGRCSCAGHSHAPACARPRAPPRARTRGLPTRGEIQLRWRDHTRLLKYMEMVHGKTALENRRKPDGNLLENCKQLLKTMKTGKRIQNCQIIDNSESF